MPPALCLRLARFNPRPPTAQLLQGAFTQEDERTGDTQLCLVTEYMEGGSLVRSPRVVAALPRCQLCQLTRASRAPPDPVPRRLTDLSPRPPRPAPPSPLLAASQPAARAGDLVEARAPHCAGRRASAGLPARPAASALGRQELQRKLAPVDCPDCVPACSLAPRCARCGRAARRHALTCFRCAHPWHTRRCCCREMAPPSWETWAWRACSPTNTCRRRSWARSPGAPPSSCRVVLGGRRRPAGMPGAPLPGLLVAACACLLTPQLCHPLCLLLLSGPHPRCCWVSGAARRQTSTRWAWCSGERLAAAAAAASPLAVLLPARLPACRCRRRLTSSPLSPPPPPLPPAPRSAGRLRRASYRRGGRCATRGAPRSARTSCKTSLAAAAVQTPRCAPLPLSW